MLETIAQRNPNSDVLLNAVNLIDGEMEVSWVNKFPPDRFSLVWLRDHCHSKESLNPETLQRQVDTFAIPVDIAPAKLEVIDGGGALHIVWKHDGTSSLLPAAFLWNIAQGEGRERAPQRRLWDGAAMATDFPTMDHAEIMSGDAGLLRWLSMVEEYGFALAAGVPPTIEATKKLGTRIGYVRETIFGGMWDFTANLAFKDSAYTSASIGPHTDGTYSIDPPGLQMFHCLTFDGTGAENTLVDGFKVAETIRRTDPAAFA